MTTTANNQQVQRLQANLENIWNDIDRLMEKKEAALACAGVFTDAEWGYGYYMDLVEAYQRNIENLLWVRDVTKRQLTEAMG